VQAIEHGQVEGLHDPGESVQRREEARQQRGVDGRLALIVYESSTCPIAVLPLFFFSLMRMHQVKKEGGAR
jgi:hypothetical protein